MMTRARPPVASHGAALTPRVLVFLRALALMVGGMVALLGCRHDAAAGAPAGSRDNASEDGGLLARASAAGRRGSPLEDRPSVLSLAEAVESLAVKEGAGARAARLHQLAASVLERSFRRFGREQDAAEAALLFRQASSDLRLGGACGSALRGAHLAGEGAGDAGVTFTELYRLERRLRGLEASDSRSSDSGGDGDGGAASPPDPSSSLGQCASRVEQELQLLVPFRPAARVLAAIDEGLEGVGALPRAVSSPSTRANSGAQDGSRLPRIVSIEPIAGAEAARVVIVLSKNVGFHAGDIAVPGMGPPRTFVDLDGVGVGATTQDFAMAGIVTRVRVEPSAAGARVTLDLDGQAYRKVFYLPEPYRVIVDIARHPPGTNAASGKRRVERIVIDPGHGGWDPGAIGQGGLREKDVTLDLARRVAPVLTREGLTVLLTRDDDRYVPLEERTARANAFGADLFVSIHCNAAENRLRHGVETYVLDTTKDEIASRIAARENATSQAATAEIGSILASLRLADQGNHSTHLAELMQRSAMVSLRDGYRDVHDGGVHTAGFYVLVGARMPSILFETSYISNPTEETRLAFDDYRRRLADAVVNAVRAYREGH